MDIAFSTEKGCYRADNLTVAFLVSVDGQAVECAISVEALEDHFAAPSNDEAGWLYAFEASRQAIQQCAYRHLTLGAVTPVLLRSGHFNAAAPIVVTLPVK